MTNIILISNGARPRLLEQAIRTLIENTVQPITLTVVDDGCEPAVALVMDRYDTDIYSQISLLRVRPAVNIIGRLKNLGAMWSEKHFGRGEYLLFCDDDICFLPDWLPRMTRTLDTFNQVRILGGVRHPYHGVNESFVYADMPGGTYVKGQILQLKDPLNIEVTDAVAGYSHFMRWSTWDAMGPYTANQKGIGASEDFALCRKVIEAGGKVGYIKDPVMAHCGLTDSQGKPILGGELIVKVDGLIYE